MFPVKYFFACEKHLESGEKEKKLFLAGLCRLAQGFFCFSFVCSQIIFFKMPDAAVGTPAAVGGIMSWITNIRADDDRLMVLVVGIILIHGVALALLFGWLWRQTPKQRKWDKMD